MGVHHLTVVGNNVRIHYDDGELIDAYPTGTGTFLPARGSTGGGEPPVDPPDPEPGEWTHPLPGSIITSPWGPRQGDFHYGCDFAYVGGRLGDVLAPTAMIVDVADGTSNASAGYYVSARSVDGQYTFKFYHMSAGSLTVSPGQTVAVGTKIGVEGNTGNSFGAHLHFEVFPGSLNNPWPPPFGPMTIDPVPLLQSHGVIV